MKIRRNKIIETVLIVVLAFASLGCNKVIDVPLEVAKDEIALQIKMDIKDDIGLLIVDYEGKDTSGSGGISNADKSLLKHGETLIYTLNKQELDNLLNEEDLSMQFTIITDYVDPNYENVYPKELTKSIEPFHIKVIYGKTYFIAINEDEMRNYTVTLEE